MKRNHNKRGKAGYAAPRRKPRLTAQQRMKQQKLKQQLLSAGGIAIGVCLFVFCVGFLIQRYYIFHLDRQVTALQQEYDAIKDLNESKEGKLVEKLGYEKIQALAESYGMQTPTEDQMVKETVTPQTMDESAWVQTKWYHQLMK